MSGGSSAPSESDMLPRPFLFPIQAGVPLLVLSCSSTKAPAPVNEWIRFFDFYDGPMWRQVKLSGFPQSNVAAISAGYGFLAPGQPVMPYDQVMDEKRSRHFCGSGDHVAQLAKCAELAGSAFIVGGGLYQELAHTAARWRKELEPLLTFASGSFLRQRKQLSQFLTNWREQHDHD